MWTVGGNQELYPGVKPSPCPQRDCDRAKRSTQYLQNPNAQQSRKGTQAARARVCDSAACKHRVSPLGSLRLSDTASSSKTAEPFLQCLMLSRTSLLFILQRGQNSNALKAIAPSICSEGKQLHDPHGTQGQPDPAA